MAIEIRCANVAGFDSASGEYRKCNQKIRVSAKMAGRNVKCPKCSQEIEIPFQMEQATTNTRSQSQPALDSAEYSLELPKKRGIMEMDFDSESDSVSSAAFEPNAKRCPKCGGLFSDEGICTLCNFVEPVQKARKDRTKNAAAIPAGFQLWLTQMSNEPKTIVWIGYFLFVALTLLVLSLIALGILSTSLVGVALAVLSAFTLLALWSTFLKTRQLAKDPDAGLGHLTPLWTLLLAGARHFNWEKYDSRYTGRKIIDLRNKTISDSDLPLANGFKKAHVIDLEGCNISDKGLLHLYGHNNLHCLVVRNTNVTRRGVAMLQQAIPRLWIWQ